MLRVVQYYCNFPLWIDHLMYLRPKLQRIGYLPVFNMRLNRLIKSQESFMGIFLILERHLFNILSISGANCLSSVC